MVINYIELALGIVSVIILGVSFLKKEMNPDKKQLLQLVAVLIFIISLLMTMFI